MKKYSGKMISVILIAIMLMSVIPTGLAKTVKQEATKATEIKSITITNADVTPIAGEKAADNLGYTIAESEPYTVVNHYWYDEDIGNNFDGIFVEGTRYDAFWRFKAKEGYEFTEDTVVTLNGGTALLDSEYTEIDVDDSTIFYVWTKPTAATTGGETKTINSITITDVDLNPVPGDKANDHITYTIASGEHYKATEAGWFDLTNHGWFDSDDDVFVKGNKYQFGWWLYADAGYEFTEYPTITINDGVELDMNVTYRNDSDYAEYYVWTKGFVSGAAETQSINSITITDADVIPIAGEKAADNLGYTIAESEPYTVVAHYWYDEDIGDEFHGIFVEGTRYDAFWRFKAKEGYEFVKDTVVTLNGGTALLDSEYTEIDGYDSTIFYVWTRPTAATTDGTLPETIDSITITDADLNPVPGDKANDHSTYTIASGEHYKTIEAGWFDLTNHEWFDSDVGVFARGNKYQFCWVLDADAGYEFTEYPTITINDGVELDLELTYRDGSDYARYYVWTKGFVSGAAETQSINSITITDADLNPVPGDKANDHITYTIATGSHFKATEAGWYDIINDVWFDSDNDVFVEGNTYQFGWWLVADAGYEFTEHPTITINDGVELDVEYTCRDGSDYTIYYVWTKGFTAQAAPEYLLGDVNSDGVVNTADATMVLRYAAVMVELDEVQLKAGDVTGDGSVNTGDAVQILKFAAGMITEFK